jgi:uncharacterized Zn-binding protein involved in type VI secretion
MMPAARVGEMHVGPMHRRPWSTPIPQVGGPIVPPGSLQMLIGFRPATPVGDIRVCVGPPASLPCSATLLIGGWCVMTPTGNGGDRGFSRCRSGHRLDRLLGN